MVERVFALPDPGEGLTEAEVVTWLVAEGDTVELNQPLAEVETAKAVVEIPSPYAGVVVRLHAEAGGSVAVGEALVTFRVDGGDEDSAGGSARSHAASSDGSEAADGSRRGAGPPAPPSPPPAASSTSTPAVRRLARDLGVDVGAVAGTGPSGRVTAEDVRRAAEATSGHSDAVATGGGGEVRGLDAVRRAVGRVLTEQAAIPQVTTFRTVECTALEDVRREREVSPLPVVAAALCRTIDAHPLLNSAWTDQGILVGRPVDIAIATDTERGLMVPVVRDAGRRGIGDLAREVRRVADIARAGQLTPADTANATIGLSNTGSYGSEAGTPILTPGSAVTLAIGVIAPRALVVSGDVVARPACTLSLTFDHRVLDGAAAGRALTDLVALLQDPARLRDLSR
jgi:pyruvate dehydrogenase E2 component (dihydrolipoamide acetyltransferase)